MTTLMINGRKVQVDDSFLSMSPEQQNATVDEIAASLGGNQPQQTAPEQAPQPTQKPQEGNDALSMGRTVSGGLIEGIPVLGPLLRRGTEKAAAATYAAFDPDVDYAEALRRVDMANQQEKAANPILDIGSQVAGGIAATVPVAATATGARLLGITGPTLGARVGMSAASGAALSGADSVARGGDVSDAIGGAVAGGVIGGAVPAIAAGAKAAAKPVVDAIRGRADPAGYAGRKIAERLASSNMTLPQAANKMEASGLSLVDVSGKSGRDLLRASANIPGKAKDAINKTITLRQFGQGDRIKGVVREVLADPDGFITAGDKLSKAWSQVGGEVYEPALAKKVVWTDRLKQFVDEPIFKRGLAQGVKIQRLESLAEGKPFNPVDYAITGFNEAGDPIISGVPNMRTLNVAKKGIDAIIGEMKNPLTGKLTEEGRATNMVQKAFLAEIDRWNPDYQKARSVWGGFAKVKEALDFGQKEAMTLSPEAVAKTFKEMSTAEQQAARIGIADAIRKRVDAAGFTQNALLRFFSNRQNVGVLKAAFPDQETFTAFRKEMFNEARRRATYDAVKGNSTTAAQMAEMVDAGGLADGVRNVGTALSGRPVAAIMDYVGSRLKMLGGFTPEVASQVSKRLLSTNPEAVRALAAEISAIEASKATAAIKSQNIQALISRALQTTALATASQPR
jgi:hypothetical protein